MSASALFVADIPEDELALIEAVAACYADPLQFVLTMYPWPINGEDGPDEWQVDFLYKLGQEVRAREFDGSTAVKPIRAGVSSGHGIGKGALTAWLVDWIMSTRKNCVGSLTANTNDQLASKTWAQVRSWTKQCLTSHWFTINSEIMYRKGSREDWFCMPRSCAENNSEAFAGQHAKASTSFYINDEDSAVPDKIHEVEEGGLTDGEPMIFLFGNPTRNTGKFHEAAFGKGRDRWNIKVIDSRDCKLPNKAQIEEWAHDYGEDSDFFRVRVRGLPPMSNELQFIETELIDKAKHAPDPWVLADEPWIAGVDMSGGGAAWTVCAFRRGLDGRSRRPIRIPGNKSKVDNRPEIVSRLAEVLRAREPDRRVAAMFIDSAFGAVIVQRLNDMGYANVYEVNFGGDSPDPTHTLNMRAFMWNAMKEWCARGAIDETDQRLIDDLGAPGFHHNNKHQLVLESKESMQKRGVASPDNADALCLTWAAPVAIKQTRKPEPGGQSWRKRGWSS